MFGWVLNWNDEEGALARATLTHLLSPLTSMVMLPETSMPSKPPSLLSSTLSFSSTDTNTGSLGISTGADATSAALDTSSTASPSAFRLARMEAPPGLPPPSFMPFRSDFEGGPVAAGPARDAPPNDGSGWLYEGGNCPAPAMPMPPPLYPPMPLLTPPIPGPPGLLPPSILLRSISMAFFFITSLVSLILDWIIILCSFSSCDSISMFCRTCPDVMFSLCPPRATTSSKAKMRSKAAAAT
mmetsp:Transcript_11507/g.32312  ORF Transcript_11507/g.32312 Transcript_11507/m.32312 type:complete len:241 (+) Transcript_11507:1040-1762(+)